MMGSWAPRIRAFRAILALLVAVLLVGCSSTTTDLAAPTVAATQADGTETPTTVYGAHIDLDTVAEGDTVLWFWAPW